MKFGNEWMPTCIALSSETRSRPIPLRSLQDNGIVAGKIRAAIPYEA